MAGGSWHACSGGRIHQPDRVGPEHDFRGRAAGWLPGQRWFAGKGMPITGLTITADTVLVDGDPGLRHLIVTVAQDSGSERYQLLAGVRQRDPGPAAARGDRPGRAAGARSDRLRRTARPAADPLAAGGHGRAAPGRGAAVRHRAGGGRSQPRRTAWCSPPSRATPAWSSARTPSSRCSGGPLVAPAPTWKSPGPSPSVVPRTSPSRSAGCGALWTGSPRYWPSCPAT